jgi:type II secretory ATPase GspE/PulE/Tfp pilus assembly ATPase PilB-like protein
LKVSPSHRIDGVLIDATPPPADALLASRFKIMSSPDIASGGFRSGRTHSRWRQDYDLRVSIMPTCTVKDRAGVLQTCPASTISRAGQ